MYDKEIIDGVKNGSELCFRKLYELWVSRLYCFVYRYVKSELITDDIVQETFLKIWDGRANLDPDKSFKSYLFTISYHLILKELKRQLNNPLIESYTNYTNDLVCESGCSDEQLSFDEFVSELEKAKRFLSPRQREIFELTKENDISIPDIAQRLNISEQSVRNQLSISLKIIRSHLSKNWYMLFVFWLEL